MTQVTSPRGRSLRSRGPVAHVGRLTAVAARPGPSHVGHVRFPPRHVRHGCQRSRVRPPETDFSASATETFFSASTCKIFSNFFEKFFEKFLKISNFFKFKISIFSPETFFSASASAATETGGSASASVERSSASCLVSSKCTETYISASASSVL